MSYDWTVAVRFVLPCLERTCFSGFALMIDTIRRYWIALLVLVLVGLHASIIAVIRMQAVQAKVSPPAKSI